MKTKSSNSDNRKLMDRILPIPAMGRLLGVVATSYEMQPEFLETDFLPTLLGLGAWDDRNWSSRIALERHLAELDAATVLVDARPYIRPVPVVIAEDGDNIVRVIRPGRRTRLGGFDTRRLLACCFPW